MTRLDDLVSRIASMETDVRWLKDRGAEDRKVGTERHQQNQQAISDLTQSSGETKRALDRLASELKRQVTITPPPPLPQMQMSRTRLYALASVGLVTLWLLLQLIESGIGWAFQKLLNIKFGG